MLKLNDQGLIPAIVQDADTAEVLMLGYMSPGSLQRTLETGQVWFYSRSRADLWRKGETSGNVLRLGEVRPDCDGDVLLIKASPAGPTCHTGNRTCFLADPLTDPQPDFQPPEPGPGVLDELFAVIQDRKEARPESSYTARLFEQGRGRIAQKVLEEAGETAIAALQGETDHLTQEAADLLYHLLVLLADAGVNPRQVWEVLRERRG